MPIIVVPTKKCPPGYRRDKNGVCRPIYSLDTEAEAEDCGLPVCPSPEVEQSSQGPSHECCEGRCDCIQTQQTDVENIEEKVEDTSFEESGDGPPSDEQRESTSS